MMRLPQFHYYRPRDIGEAAQVLAGEDDAMVIAGGTDLLPNMKRRQQTPRRLFEAIIQAVYAIEIERSHRRVHEGLEVLPQIHGDGSERGRHAREFRNDDLRNVHGVRDGHGMHGPRAT